MMNNSDTIIPFIISRIDLKMKKMPEELIAQTPLEKRDASKLLILDRKTGQFQDRHFDAILDELEPGDALVMNNTRVLPARLHGVKPETGGHVEFLLLKNTQDDCWEVLAKPAKRLKVGATVSFGDGRLTATVEEDWSTEVASFASTIKGSF